MPLLLPASFPSTVHAQRGDYGRVARLTVPGNRWALLADTHLSADPEAAYDGQPTLANVRRALEQVATSGVDGVIVNGDLAWMEGRPDDYDQVAATFQQLAQTTPVAMALGNHDRLDRALRRFHPSAFSLNEPAKLITVIDAPAVRFVLLDSLYRTDVVPGLLGRAQRAWLRAFLDAEDKRPTVIVVHHPLSDDDGALLDGDRLLAILQPREQVKAVVTAHDHVWRHERRGRLHVVGLPAAGFSFTPASVSVGWIQADFSPHGAQLELRTEGAPEALELEWRPECYAGMR
jgi:3',5'-cyclic AMP phosphodiesterase CpdA